MLLALRNVSKTYPMKRASSVTAVSGLDLEVQQGEFLVVTGRSGSGKTTLLNLVAGLARPSAGQVLVEDTDIWRLGDREQSDLRSRHMGFIFQFPSLLPSLTVLDNVLLPTIFTGSPDRQARAQALLSEVGLADKMRAYPSQLSAGQQQRAVVARSLINQPKILLADEPTSNLDEQTEREIINLLEEIHAGNGITILLVTHAAGLVTRGSRLVLMEQGALVKDSKGSMPSRLPAT